MIIKNGIIIDYENCVRCGCELRGIGFDDGLCDDCYDDDLDDQNLPSLLNSLLTLNRYFNNFTIQ